MKKGLLFVAIVLVFAAVGLHLAADMPVETDIEARVPRENIVSDAIARRTTAQGVEVNVSDIAKKYIAVGDSRESVMHYLKATGFEMFLLPQNVEGNDLLIATRYPMERLLGNYYTTPIFTDALRVWVHFDGQTVASVEGHITYRAL